MHVRPVPNIVFFVAVTFCRIFFVCVDVGGFGE